jgi:hypothetical protein
MIASNNAKLHIYAELIYFRRKYPSGTIRGKGIDQSECSSIRYLPKKYLTGICFAKDINFR